jgi:squalene-hopene/tetraprenyl-beta-curcumene cyclase
VSGERLVPASGKDLLVHGVSTIASTAERRDSTVATAADRAARRLLDLQRPDGHWVGELQGDTILESEYVLLLAFLGRENEPRARKLANYIRALQQADGGWSNYPDGPLELSVSVKAYFALKLTGHHPDEPYMVRARGAIRATGGAVRCNSFTKFYLALLGEFPYENCASVPPEMMLLPRWCYFHLHAMSSWTRTIVVPLSIFSACKPVRRLPPEKGIAELFLDPPQARHWPAEPTRRRFSWTNFFLGLDWLYKKAERWGLLKPMRGWAIRRAAEWMRERFADSDGLGAIFPPMIYTVIALRCLGVADDDPEMQWALLQLDDLMIEDADTLRLQPCLSPVWDTALALNALADAFLLSSSLGGEGSACSSSSPRPSPLGGEASAYLSSSSLPLYSGGEGSEVRGEGHCKLQIANCKLQIDRAIDWLLAREVCRLGDWCRTAPELEPAGWFFEYRNGFYPDTDDTAMVLKALAKHGHGGDPAAARGLRWLLGMQNRNGGWAAFDRNINREILTKVPFADHNAMLDPSCPDITARVLDALGHYGIGVEHTQVRPAIDFLRATQDQRGCWPGRWGVNYVYGTWQVLVGLRQIGFDMRDPMVRRAVGWLRLVQQASGAWGESCRSYDDPQWAGKGEPTPSQTAWALLGLLAAGEHDSDAVRAGIDYLVQTQRRDGGWDEGPFTGTGFPKVFYLKYHLYSLYFPLMALARYAHATTV